MRDAERAFDVLARGERVNDVEAVTYFGPLARAARQLRLTLEPSVLVLGACASASIAIGLATLWLERATCDLVLAGGFDEVTVFVAAGFEALRATTAAPPPRPFRLGRDGMALGEGAAVLALARPESHLAARFVSGFGVACDAGHITAPNREGTGLARAAVEALDNAGRPHVDLVSAHATATPYNDVAEFRGLALALGRERASEVFLHPFKAQIGHAMGAAGALELLACIDALERGLIPAAAGEGAIDPESPARLLARTASAAPKTVLKLASAFGGANAALVVTGERQERSAAKARRPVFLHSAAHLPQLPSLDEVAARVRLAPDRVARADAGVCLGLAVVSDLEGLSGPLAGAGVVVGSALATLETNALFSARVRERGAAAAAPRLFPYTSPNAVAGECSSAFGLTGPSFAVGGGMHAAIEAMAVAAVLIEAGHAERMVVVGVDDVGPITRALLPDAGLASGAVAVMLSAQEEEACSGRRARARIGEITLRRGPPAAGAHAVGHRALVPLVTSPPACELACSSPPDLFARLVLESV
jgi:3-oxoacyl-[acyl-carrier-protein] synthase-1/3-oxoacyl-[acyl-carrier-protein] synthase II